MTVTSYHNCMTWIGDLVHDLAPSHVSGVRTEEAILLIHNCQLRSYVLLTEFFILRCIRYHTQLSILLHCLGKYKLPAQLDSWPF